MRSLEAAVETVVDKTLKLELELKLPETKKVIVNSAGIDGAAIIIFLSGALRCLDHNVPRLGTR